MKISEANFARSSAIACVNNSLSMFHGNNLSNSSDSQLNHG